MDATATLNTALSGRYEIERELGRGGMATVYLARDLRHDRRVAVKVLDPELGAILGVERFLSEIRVTANLQHPHLLPLFDSGAAGGLLYYVMPYVEGESLRARLDREKQLPVDEAVRLATAVLAALDYAHEHGVVHRDLKPENILLQHGEPVVADFGIALAVSNAGGARITQTGLSLGTPQYMSPEQATGDRLIDARSDIYSMGAVLYEMLAGEPPHTGASVQAIIAKVITERPRSLRIGRDTVPEAVDHAVLKALAKIPADRWSSARAFADALRGGGTIVAASGRGLVASLGRNARRVGGSVAFWRGAAVVIAVVAGWLAWSLFRAPAPTGEFQLANQLTFDGKVIGAAISPDGGWLAYVTDDCFGKDVICTHSLQVREVDGTQSLKLVTWPAIGSDLHWSRDGSIIAFEGSPDSSAAVLHFIPRLGGQPQRVPLASTARTFGPSGKLVLASGPPGRQSLLWFDQKTLARTDSQSLAPGLTVGNLDIASDGQRMIATGGSHSELLLLLDGRGRLLDSSSALGVRDIARWDGRERGVLVATAAPGTGDHIRYVPVDRSKLRIDRVRVALGGVQDGADGLIDVAHTGRLVIVQGPTQYQVLMLRIGVPGAQWKPVADHTSWVWGSAFSPDGSIIAGSATDNLGDNVYLFPLDSAAPRRVSGQRGLRDFPLWSADGRHLAYSAWTVEGDIIGFMMTDPADGRERPVSADIRLGDIVGWAGNDAIVLFQNVALSLIDTTGKLIRTIGIPDSLAVASKLIADAATRRAVWWSANAGAIAVADLASGRVAAVFRSKTYMQPLGWGRDGTLFVVTAATTSEGGATRKELVLEKLAPGAGALVSIARLPSGCKLITESIVTGATVGAGGTLASCTVRRYAPDVWLANESAASR
jgi:hypothetical protein